MVKTLAEFRFQYIHDGSQLPTVLVLGDLMFSSDLPRHCVVMGAQTYI